MNITSRKRDEKGRYLPNSGTVEKKRKAIVKYRRTADGKNKIVALEGFLTSDEIQEIGTEVFRIWYSNEHNMSAQNCTWVHLKIGMQDALVDQIYTDKEFNSLIAEMKACGKALSRIIKDVRAAELAEIKVIEI